MGYLSGVPAGHVTYDLVRTLPLPLPLPLSRWGARPRRRASLRRATPSPSPQTLMLTLPLALAQAPTLTLTPNSTHIIQQADLHAGCREQMRGALQASLPVIPPPTALRSLAIPPPTRLRSLVTPPNAARCRLPSSSLAWCRCAPSTRYAY